MGLNLPLNLEDKKSIMFLGVGGGYDIMGAVPLFMEIDNKRFTWVSYNPKLKNDVEECRPGKKSEITYVEHGLANWLHEITLDYNVYAIPKSGVITTTAQLNKLAKDNEVDIIILVDGGVDSLMAGDEEGAGTFLDDTVTMMAAAQVPNVTKVLACIGFGTELEEEVCHHHTLRNMAQLCADGAFYGSCSLVKDSESFKLYQDACEYVWKNSRRSHIHTKVISAVHGEFGNTNMYEGVDAQVGGVKCLNYISPLMSIYWFFDLDRVLKRNKVASALKLTKTSTDVLMVYRQMIDQLNATKKLREKIPY